MTLPADENRLPGLMGPAKYDQLQRLVIVALLVIGISLLHYLTSTLHHPSHDVYRRLYYVPIVLGGLWFHLRGGLMTSLAVTAAYLPHVIFQWKMRPEMHLEQYLELIVYNLIGALTGYLSWREHRQTARYQQAALQLQQSYGKLKQQADTILDIEHRLRHSERLSALGELTAGLAHEIRNPLGSLRMAAEVVNEGIDPKDPRAEFGKILLKESQRLDSVLNDFLQFARPEQNERTMVNIAELLIHAQALLTTEGLAKDVTFEIHCNPEIMIEASESQLQQVVLNLMKNAVEAMDGTGKLSVTCLRQKDKIVLEICDTGPGIDPGYLERIFNPFFTTREEGTGLGLSISARIIQTYGGSLNAANRPDEGACFSIELPMTSRGGQHARSRHTAD